MKYFYIFFASLYAIYISIQMLQITQLEHHKLAVVLYICTHMYIYLFNIYIQILHRDPFLEVLLNIQTHGTPNMGT